MNRELEKDLADKVLKYKIKTSTINNGLLTKKESELLSEFYNYLLKYSINKLSDIPSKYDPIIKA